MFSLRSSLSSLTIVALALALPACSDATDGSTTQATTPIPSSSATVPSGPTTFGQPVGCYNSYVPEVVHLFDATRQQVLAIEIGTINKAAVGETRTLPVTDAVRVDVYAKTWDDTFCQDFKPTPPVINETWKATAGTVTVKLETAPAGRERAFAYEVTITYQGLALETPSGKRVDVADGTYRVTCAIVA